MNEQLIEKEYKPFTDLTHIKINAIIEALKQYSIYGLVNDWSLGINDFDFDTTMLSYLKGKQRKCPTRDWSISSHNTLYNRLYVTMLSISRLVGLR